MPRQTWATRGNSPFRVRNQDNQQSLDSKALMTDTRRNAPSAPTLRHMHLFVLASQIHAAVVDVPLEKQDAQPCERQPFPELLAGRFRA